MKAAKPRRVRIGQCEYCGHLFQFQRRSAADVAEGVSLQQCTNCFAVHNGRDMPSRLENVPL